jgi:O-antigen/teichoic acid export membrane protein
MSDGRRLVRNSALNMLGLVVPLVIAVVAMPLLIRGLGAERFGILTLAWAAIGYFNLFELGLSRALTQAVSRRLRTDDAADVPALVWTTLAVLLGLGLIAAMILVASTPAIVERALDVSGPLRSEAMTSFYVLAAALPMVMMSAGMRGLMEAHQDFGTVTAIRLPLATFTFLGPLMVLPFSRGLTPAVSMLVAGRLLGWSVSLVTCLRRYPYLRTGLELKGSLVRPLLQYGGWATVSSIVSPIMMYMDRFLIGAVLSIAAVTHYVTPYEVVTKLMIIPGSVLGAVFPALAATYSTDQQRMARLYDRSQRMVLLLMFPLVLPVVALAHEGLQIWIGNVLPAESAGVLQWLALGVFINSIAHAPHTALLSAGRPDLVAKMHLAELPLYALAVWWLLHTYGIIGVAIAWTLRVTMDTAVHFFVAHRKLALDAGTALARVRLAALMLAALAVATTLTSTRGRVLYVVIALLLFAWLTTRSLLTPSERAALFVWVRSARVFRRTGIA